MLVYFVLIYALLWKLPILQNMDSLIRQKAIIVTSLLYCVALYALICLLEGMKIGQRRILDLIFGFFFSSFCINVVAALIIIVFQSSLWKMLILYVAALTAIQSVIGFGWIIWCHRIYEKYQFRREAVFVYGTREDEGEYTRVNNTIHRYFTISRSIDFHEGTEHIFEQIKDSVVVFLGDIPVDVRNIILKFCMKNKIECYCIPKISDIYIQNSKVLQLNDKLLLRYPPLAIEGIHAVLKRMLDIIVALLMLICFSPIMLVIAICVKKEDGGKIFYYQDRVTLHGKPFQMCKFRSMREDAEKDGIQLAKKNDERVTGIGKIIRNLHFDELPQLIQVLKGDMSLVGPRPERQEYINAYTQRIPEFKERLKVKAGLTGYAQVYGRYNSEPEDKIKYDLYYIYNYSFWLDIKLLILTVRILFQKENTEGFDPDIS